MSRMAGALLIGVLATGDAPAAGDAPGFVIVNARVIDGSGGPSREASVRIVGKRIAAVGEFERPEGDIVVDARGLVLAPGFIDAHSHHEDGLFESPDALAAVSQGVTTIVVGQDGSHPHPLAAFFRRLESSPASVNVASFAGHGTIRSRVMGEDFRRRATAQELAAMQELLAGELEAGALGLSSGLEYDPGSYSAPAELVDLARVAAAHGGRYISHLRSEDQYFWEAVDEIIDIGRQARLPVQVTHVKLAMSRWWGQADRLMAKLDTARAAGVDVTADIYPYTAWNAGFGWLATLFPERDLDRREGAEYILQEMLAPDRILLPDFRPQPDYDGKTIAEIAKLRGSDPVTTLIALLKADAAAADPSPMLGIAMDEPDIEALMAWPHTVICSDGELAGPHPRGFGAFTRYLGHYIRDRKVLSLEEGIHRITALAARQAGIVERGSIETGHYADLVLFDPAQVRDRATYAQPHLPSVGIARVWVNGTPVFEGGRVTGSRPGAAIRRPARPSIAAPSPQQ